jgi:hypothetical protein
MVDKKPWTERQRLRKSRQDLIRHDTLRCTASAHHGHAWSGEGIGHGLCYQLPHVLEIELLVYLHGQESFIRWISPLPHQQMLSSAMRSPLMREPTSWLSYV